ncbi:esterase family protein [Cardiobacteriaceae bacterium TAE3-ERU3]|nr:esterase family protein [Cardiobacteriaceae bacterium TAE3-ERU3]
MTHHIELLDKHVSFEGEQRFYRDYAEPLERDVELAIYVPTAALEEQYCPVVYFLPDLHDSARSTSNQSDYQRYANRYETILVIPDLFGDYEGDTHTKLQRYHAERAQIHEYILKNLPAVIEHHFRAYEIRSIMGFGFGGTLAMNLALAHPEAFRGVSAMAPWLGFYHSPWYRDNLADLNFEPDIDPLNWFEENNDKDILPLWIDQGMDDDLLGRLIHIDTFEQSVTEHKDNEKVWINQRPRYDHTFYFVHSHIREHFVFHNEHHDDE